MGEHDFKHDENTRTLDERIDDMQRVIDDFLETQRLIKDVLHMQSFDSNPTRCNIGDIVVVSGKLKVCTAADTWTVVGTQT